MTNLRQNFSLYITSVRHSIKHEYNLIVAFQISFKKEQPTPKESIYDKHVKLTLLNNFCTKMIEVAALVVQ